MTQNDPLAAVLSAIMNHERVAKKELYTRYNSKIIRKVLSILQENRYLGSFEQMPDGKNNILKINLLRNINKVGVIKPRSSVKSGEYVDCEKKYLPAKNFGIIVLSTSKGLMTLQQAREQKIGGKLLCYCY